MHYKTLMAEFGTGFKGEEDLRAKRKHFLGVSKKGDKWQARIRNPKKKAEVHLGYYSTPEKAALVVKKKKAELRELYLGKKPRACSDCKDDDKEVLQETTSEVAGKDDDDDEVLQETSSEVSNDRIWLGSSETLADAIRCYSMMKKAELEEKFMGKEDDETCDDGVSMNRKHLFGVTKSGNRWQARIRHPKLKVRVHLGCYSTPEEAALVVEKKKAEFEKMFKAEDGLREKRRVHEFEGRKLSSGVTREKGKFRVRLWHPELKKYASFGSYSTRKEAAVVADRKRAELQEVYGGKLRGSSECEDDDDDVVLLECESNFESEENSPFVGDKRVTDQMSRRKTACSLDEKLYSESEPTVAEKARDTENSSSSPAIEPGDVFNFDEAVRLGTINEYGQLLGEFSFLDEPIWFEM